MDLVELCIDPGNYPGAPVVQSGLVRSYALAFLLGAAALLLYLGLRV